MKLNFCISYLNKTIKYIPTDTPTQAVLQIGRHVQDDEFRHTAAASDVVSRPRSWSRDRKIEVLGPLVLVSGLLVLFLALSFN